MPTTKSKTKRSPLKPSSILSRSLKLLAGGKKWGKGRYYFEGKYCALGAIQEIDTPREQEAIDYLGKALRCSFKSITAYNDSPKRIFPQIKSLFKRAIALAKKDGN